jgi:hypothetical protein
MKFFRDGKLQIKHFNVPMIGGVCREVKRVGGRDFVKRFVVVGKVMLARKSRRIFLHKLWKTFIGVSYFVHVGDGEINT